MTYETNDEIRADLIRTKKGVRGCGSNIELVLRFSEELRGRVRFNTLTKSIEVSGGRFSEESPNGLDVAIKNWMETEFELFVNVPSVGEQLLRVARRFGSYNPVAEYLESLTWDGVARLDCWLETYCHAQTTNRRGEDIAPYVRCVSAMFMLSCVARALKPGCKVDTVLVLEGDQGFKKSTSFSVLADKWFADTPIDIGSKDGRLIAGNKWIIELAELAALAKSAVESQKAFLSQCFDTLRPPYGRVPEDFDRTSVFAGTVNPDKDGEVEYLSDETGHRRWWPVRVGGVCEIEILRRDRDQLWAEAVHRYKRADENPERAATGECPGERWWFTLEEQRTINVLIMSDREVGAVWTALIDAWWARRKKSLATEDPDSFTLADVAEGALKIREADMPRYQKAIGAALRAAGYQKFESTNGRRWRRCETALASL
ncbi:MAG TPA: virulence-associated E family protein [Kofleriaceae bacterium]|jgi:predicted P-loop ATPase